MFLLTKAGRPNREFSGRSEFLQASSSTLVEEAVVEQELRAIGGPLSSLTLLPRLTSAIDVFPRGQLNLIQEPLS